MDTLERRRYRRMAVKSSRRGWGLPSTKGTRLRIREAAGEDAETVLVLEGWLVGSWAALLCEECRRLLEAGRSVRLDLSGVSNVDERAMQLLCTMFCLTQDRASVLVSGAPDTVLARLHQASA